MAAPKQILIAMPTAQGIAKAEVLNSLVGTTLTLTNLGFRIAFQHLDGSDIAYARNYFGSLLLSKPGFTHLLFIDSDMAFPGEVVRRLAAADHDIAGVAYPKKRLDLRRFTEAHEAGTDLRRSVSRAVDYTVRLRLDQERIDFVQGFASVYGIGMGLTLIKAGVFERLRAEGLVPPRRTRHGAAPMPMWGFFDPIPAENEILSEDFSFCQRWCDGCGGQVWALSTAEVRHIGNFGYSGNYVDQFQ